MPYRGKEIPQALWKSFRSRHETRIFKLQSDLIQCLSFSFDQKTRSQSDANVPTNLMQIINKDSPNNHILKLTVQKFDALPTGNDSTEIQKMLGKKIQMRELSPELTDIKVVDPVLDVELNSKGFSITDSNNQNSYSGEESFLISLWKPGYANEDVKWLTQIRIPLPIFVMTNEEGKTCQFLFQAQTATPSVFFFYFGDDGFKRVGFLKQDSPMILNPEARSEWKPRDGCETIKILPKQALEKALEDHEKQALNNCWPVPKCFDFNESRVFVFTVLTDDKQSTKLVFINLEDQKILHTETNAFIFAGFDQDNRILYFPYSSQDQLVGKSLPCFQNAIKKQDIGTKIHKLEEEMRYFIQDLPDNGFVDAQVYESGNKRGLLITVNNKTLTFDTDFKWQQKDVSNKKWTCPRTNKLFSLQLISHQSSSKPNVLGVGVKLTCEKEFKMGHLGIPWQDFSFSELTNDTFQDYFTVEDACVDPNLQILTGTLKIAYVFNQVKPRTYFFSCNLKKHLQTTKTEQQQHNFCFKEVKQQPCLTSNNWLAYCGSHLDKREIVVADYRTNTQTILNLNNLRFVAWVHQPDKQEAQFVARNVVTSTLLFCLILANNSGVEVIQVKDSKGIFCSPDTQVKTVTKTSLNVLVVQTTDSIALFDLITYADPTFEFSRFLSTPSQTVRSNLVVQRWTEVLYMKKLRRKDEHGEQTVQCLYFYHSGQERRLYQHHPQGAPVIGLQIHTDNSQSSKKTPALEVFLLDQNHQLHLVKIDNNKEGKLLWTKSLRLEPSLENTSWLNFRVDEKSITYHGRTYLIDQNGGDNRLSEHHHHHHIKPLNHVFESEFHFSEQVMDPLPVSKMVLAMKFRGVPFWSIKQSPGSRKVVLSNISSCSMVPVTNKHVMVEMQRQSTRQAIYDLQTGCEIPQPEQVQRLLERAKIIAQSEMVDGLKNVLLKPEERSAGVVTFDPESGIGRVLSTGVSKRNKIRDLKYEDRHLIFINSQGLIHSISFQEKGNQKPVPRKSNLSDTKNEVDLKELVVTYKNESDKTEVETASYLIVGPYLVRLKDGVLEFKEIDNSKLQDNNWFQVDFNSTLKNIEDKSILLDVVPASTVFTNCNSQGDNRKHVIQVTLSNQVALYDLDTKQEFMLVEDTKKLRTLDSCNYFDFGFKAAHSQTNELRTFVFDSKQFLNNNVNYQTVYYLPFSELDLLQLIQLQRKVQKGEKIQSIDPSLLSTNFYGHTIFSMFQHEPKLYERIFELLHQHPLQALGESEEDEQGNKIESTFMRQLYRLLTYPVPDYKMTAFKQLAPSLTARFQTTLMRSTSSVQKLRTQASSEDDPESVYKWAKSSRATGFKSILEKSVHYRDKRVLEALIDLTLLCKERQLQSFVANRFDFQVLKSKFTRQVKALFDNAMLETASTRNVKKLEWVADVSNRTFTYDSPRINEEIAEAQSRFKRKKGRINAQVKCKAMQMDWIHREDGNWGKFVSVLFGAPEEMFHSQVMLDLISQTWSRFRTDIILWVFFPFLINFVLLQVYLTAFVSHPDEKARSQAAKIVLQVFILMFIVWSEYIEVRQMSLKGLKYLNGWNILDQGAILLTLTIISRDYVFPDPYYDHFIVSLTSVAILILWLKLFYWLRLFDSFALYIRLITQTLTDSMAFLLLMFLIMGAFGSALYILNMENLKNEGDTIYAEVFGNYFADSIVSQYLLSQGEYGFDDFSGKSSVFQWVYLLVAIFIVQVTFLNMLIAVMGDTFDQVMESRAQMEAREKAGILTDYSHVFLTNQSDKTQRYFFSLRHKEGDEVEGVEIGAWTGKISQITKSINAKIQRQEERADAKAKKQDLWNEKMKIKQEKIKTDLLQQFTLMNQRIDSQNKEIGAIKHMILKLYSLQLNSNSKPQGQVTSPQRTAKLHKQKTLELTIDQDDQLSDLRGTIAMQENILEEDPAEFIESDSVAMRQDSGRAIRQGADALANAFGQQRSPLVDLDAGKEMFKDMANNANEAWRRFF